MESVGGSGNEDLEKLSWSLGELSRETGLSDCIEVLERSFIGSCLSNCMSLVFT